MKPFLARTLAVAAAGSVLGLGLLRADEPNSDDIKRKAAQAAIQQLMENLDAKDVSDRAKKIVKEHESEFISSVFTMHARGGLGVGRLTEVGFQDGIERFIKLLARRKTTTENELNNYQEDYLRIAKLFQAMSQLAPHRASERTKSNHRELKEWIKVTSEFQHLATEFRRAVQEKDPKQVRLAALSLSQTCCDCHSLADR
jgi:hypothetical protein